MEENCFAIDIRLKRADSSMSESQSASSAPEVVTWTKIKTMLSERFPSFGETEFAFMEQAVFKAAVLPMWKFNEIWESEQFRGVCMVLSSPYFKHKLIHIISKEAASDALRGALEGTFLIRVSSTLGSITLDCQTADGIRHIRINTIASRKLNFKAYKTTHSKLSRQLAEIGQLVPLKLVAPQALALKVFEDVEIGNDSDSYLELNGLVSAIDAQFRPSRMQN